MRPTHNQNGSALVDLLFVIAIFVVLAVAMANWIQSAISDHGTGIKSRGRGIWLAIMSANMEREAIKLGPLWPHEAKLPVDQGGAGLTFTNATGYFKELMAESNPGSPLAGDLKTEMLSARDWPMTNNATALTAKNIAWRVAEVSDSSASADAFLISKDIAPLSRSGASNDRVTYSRSGPFKGKHVVWVTRGGGVFITRKKFATKWGVFFPSTNNVPFLAD
jgi:hypothetical protein